MGNNQFSVQDIDFAQRLNRRFVFFYIYFYLMLITLLLFFSRFPGFRVGSEGFRLVPGRFRVGSGWFRQVPVDSGWVPSFTYTRSSLDRPIRR